MKALQLSLGLVLTAVLSPLLTLTSAHAWPEKWSVAGIQGGSVRFSSPEGAAAPSPLKLSSLGIKDPQLMGALDSEAKAAPYLLLSGLSADTQDRALFLIRADGSMKPQRITFPGKLLDPKTRDLVYESRVFFGRCLLKQKYDAIVVFQREHMDRKRGLQRSVYIAEAAPTMLEERLLERGLPSERMVQMKVRGKQCAEITGRNRTFDLGFFSLRSRRGSDLADDDSDDDDEKNKEKDALKKAEFDTE